MPGSGVHLYEASRRDLKGLQIISPWIPASRGVVNAKSPQGARFLLRPFNVFGELHGVYQTLAGRNFQKFLLGFLLQFLWHHLDIGLLLAMAGSKLVVMHMNRLKPSSLKML